MFKQHKQQELHCMIVEILWRNPTLKYYQVSHQEDRGDHSYISRYY